MKISKDLIEKYHRNECSPEETDAVEAWLFSGDSEEALQLPTGEDKTVHKNEIWKIIAADLPEDKPGTGKRLFWYGAIAASLAIGIVTLGGHFFLNNQQTDVQQLVSVNNTSAVNIKYIESGGYDIAIGTNTSARIDNLTGAVDLAGSMLISPKKDIELTFEGSSEKITFKSGQTYIILKGKDGKDKIIIVSEKNLMDLPPVLQKQIINEFNI